MDSVEFFFKALNFMIYYIQVYYLLFAVFIAIMHDAYRIITIGLGDPLMSTD